MDLISRVAANQGIRLFDYAFKKGVIDAAEMGDDFHCEQFIRKRRSTFSFGTLDTPFEMDWYEYKLIINRWCSLASLRILYNTTLGDLYRVNYVTVFFPIALDFYMMGIEEWLEYKNRVQLEIFKATPKVHWKPIKGKTMKLMCKPEFISNIQEFCYARGHRRELMKDPISPSMYTTFGMEMWRLTKPVPKMNPGDVF